MTEASPLPAAPTKSNRWMVGAVVLALSLIFGGVVLNIFFPDRGEPLGPAPSVSYPSDVGEEEMEPIPPEFFEGAPGEEEPTPGANQL